jgi:FMN phosphatase YigB (HAD superfamily)
LTAELLRHLGGQFELYLLSTGRVAFQRQKVEKLGLRKFFVEIFLVGESSAASKGRAIRQLAERRGFKSENVLVVGNRLDHEIAAGRALGMSTVWIRHGEGSELKPASAAEVPDLTLHDILHIGPLLWR